MTLFWNYLIVFFYDAPEHYQIGFQDAASSLGEEIQWFHDRLFFYFVLVGTVVLWMITQIVLSFRLKKRAITHKYLSHGTVLEIIWTLTPAFILVTIAFPSFKLLYLMDEIIDPSITIKAIGLRNDGLKFISLLLNRNYRLDSLLLISDYHPYANNFIIVGCRAANRIGPHNWDVLQVLFGSLLGDAYADHKIKTSKNIRICYRQSIIHKPYWLYQYFNQRGYVSN